MDPLRLQKKIRDGVLREQVGHCGERRVNG
jgi:hypothetical protein